MNRTLIVFVLIFFIANNVLSQEKNFAGNPVFDGWYADPEVALYNDEYWIFPTYSSKFEKQVFFDAFSSKDMVNWEKHSRILDTSYVKWAKEAMWAPATILKNGKYYLFFAANEVQSPISPWWNPDKDIEGEIGGIGVAVSDNPEGPYKDYLGKPLINEFYSKAQPIDQYVFDWNNQYFIVFGGWGHCNLAQLKSDFKGLIPFENGDMVKEITPKGYIEGPLMFKRLGKVYFMWSEGNWADSTYKVAYAIADSPFGPFKRLGTILESDPNIATGAGHHSVLNIPNTDDWYIIYHRRPIPNEDRDHRVTCIDKMFFNPDGTIAPVKMTFEGVKKRKL